MQKALALVFSGALFAALGAPSAWAQATWGAISGYVSDPSGAAVPGANVTVAEVRTGIVTKGLTDSVGLYNITHLDPGEYKLTVEASGFKRFIQEHVTLQVDSTVRIDPKLELGEVSQQVSVTAAPPLLKSEKTDVARNINEQTIQALPVTAHNLSKLFDVVPGAVENVLQIGEGETPSGATSVTVNGMWFGANEYVIDGITDTACCFSNQIVFVPNQDSVSELKMSAGDYDPEFGNSAGLIAQYVTKSGTNEIHGSVWWTNMNKATFAADPFTEKIPCTGPSSKGTGPAPFNQNQGAFSLGGPIRKNKMCSYSGTINSCVGGKERRSRPQCSMMPGEMEISAPSHRRIQSLIRRREIRMARGEPRSLPPLTRPMLPIILLARAQRPA